MRVRVFATVNLNTKPILDGLAALKEHSVDVVPTNSGDPWHAVGFEGAADICVFFGGLDQPSFVDGFELVRGARRTGPVVAIIPEASCAGWRDMLAVAHPHFDLLVNIDGNEDWRCPGAKKLTALAPIDQSYYGQPRPWELRAMLCGFGGGLGSPHRRQLLDAVGAPVVVTVREPMPDGDATYTSYAQWMRSLKSVFNMPLNSTGDSMMVKARVIEAALAGAVLIEHEESPTRKWFTPGQHYLTYRDAESARHAIDIVRVQQEITQPMAWDMWHEVTTRHSPRMFWSKVLNRAVAG